MLQEIWSELENEPDARIVVLTGSGEKAFSVGADMKDASEDAATGLEYWAKPRPGGFGGIALRTTLDVPVIARVNGYALGGGFEMVLGCDIVVACEEAQFGFPEPRVGRMPLDGGMTLLPRLAPEKWALGLLLTGKACPRRGGVPRRPRERSRPPGRARPRRRPLGRRHARVRAAFASRHQAIGETDRHALRTRRASDAASRRRARAPVGGRR